MHNSIKKLCSIPKLILFCLLSLLISQVRATPNDILISVFANEAIVTTYTFDFEHFINQEKNIAKYFTADGWLSYSQAMQNSKLPDSIKKNSYYVSSVATMPPAVKSISDTEWEVTMPLLVVYKNPAYTQKQDLNVKLSIVKSTTAGVRGFAITRLISSVISQPCRCAKMEPSAAIV